MAADFRETDRVRQHQLADRRRIATLNAESLRRFVAACAAYFTAQEVLNVTICPDDPRLVWELVDEARAIKHLRTRIHLRLRVCKLAIMAVAIHHGLEPKSSEAALASLRATVARALLAPQTAAVVGTLEQSHARIVAWREMPDRSLDPAACEDVTRQLDHVAHLLQERDPEQLSDKLWTAGS